MWKALRTINSKHAAWNHLAKNGTTEQDSQLRVENNTAEEGKSAVDKAPAQQSLRKGLNGASQDAAEKENKLCNGHANVKQESKPCKDGESDLHTNGDAHLAEGKAGKNGQLKHEESGSGEIKAHSQPLNGKAAANGSIAFT